MSQKAIVTGLQPLVRAQSSRPLGLLLPHLSCFYLFPSPILQPPDRDLRPTLFAQTFPCTPSFRVAEHRGRCFIDHRPVDLLVDRDRSVCSPVPPTSSRRSLISGWKIAASAFNTLNGIWSFWTLVGSWIVMCKLGKIAVVLDSL